MRELFLIRIVHTSADMGSMGEGLIKEGMAKVGREKWLENQRKIEKFWDAVEIELNALNLDYSKIRIYQDGLPCGGDLGLKIVKETADKGSKNYQIVRNLIERGATIEATESPELLRREYGHIQVMVAASGVEKAEAMDRYERIKDSLMQERDTFIAKAIDITLKDGEIGLLFIGAAHNVIPRLAKDILVKSLD